MLNQYCAVRRQRPPSSGVSRSINSVASCGPPTCARRADSANCLATTAAPMREQHDPCAVESIPRSPGNDWPSKLLPPLASSLRLFFLSRAIPAPPPSLLEHLPESVQSITSSPSLASHQPRRADPRRSRVQRAPGMHVSVYRRLHTCDSRRLASWSRHRKMHTPGTSPRRPVTNAIAPMTRNAILTAPGRDATLPGRVIRAA